MVHFSLHFKQGAHVFILYRGAEILYGMMRAGEGRQGLMPVTWATEGVDLPQTSKTSEWVEM